MVVGPSPGEADQAVVPGPVAVGQALQVGQHVGLPHPVGQLQPPLQPEGLRHHGEQLVDRVEAEERQHALHFVLGVGDVGAHARAPRSWCSRV